MLNIESSKLKAALSCAASKDVRFYLNGVLLECCTNGDLHLVAMDGAVLFAGLVAAPNVQWTDGPKAGPWRMIVPRDAVVSALKSAHAKRGMIPLIALSDGQYLLGDTVFTPVDGTFPDWRRVCPSATMIGMRGEAPGQFNPDLLAKCADGLRSWFGVVASKSPFYLHQFGTEAGVMTGPDCTAFAICMPVRGSEKVDHFTPAAY